MISKISRQNVKIFKNIYYKRTNQPFVIDSIDNPSLYLYVIHEAEESFGWISIAEVPKVGRTSSVFYLDELYVHPTYRNQGYATKLIRHVNKEFPDTELRLYVDKKNSTAQKVYQKCGFEIINTSIYMTNQKQ